MNSPLREQSYLETNTPNTGTNPGKQDMDEFVRLVGPNRAVEIFGIRLVGINAENGKKLLMTLLLFILIWLVRRAIRYRSRVRHLRDRRPPAVAHRAGKP
jgi:hypothetical protein